MKTGLGTDEALLDTGTHQGFDRPCSDCSSGPIIVINISECRRYICLYRLCWPTVEVRGEEGAQYRLKFEVAAEPLVPFAGVAAFQKLFA